MRRVLGDGVFHSEWPQALGVDKKSLATFPEEFKQGMPARADILGDTGANYPNNWVGGLASPDLHAIAILFARDEAERERCNIEHQKLLADCEGVEVLSSLDQRSRHSILHTTTSVTATGFRSQSLKALMTCQRPAPGRHSNQGIILGYPDENGPPVGLPEPEILSRNGSDMAYRRLQEHVGKFRGFLHQHGETPEEQELVAAKLMGRWRSGAPLVLAPDKEDPALGVDMQRNNFNYKMDPHGYAVPLGSHMRRMNPRDTAANMNRRRMIRRGATYGLPLPDTFQTMAPTAA